MELSSFAGIIIGVLAVVAAMYYKGIPYEVFKNPAALIVIFAGTMASVLNSFPGKNLKSLGKLFSKIFGKDKDFQKPAEVIDMVLEVANEVRKNGIISMESKVDSYNSRFFAKGLRLLVDGNSDETVRSLMENEISAMEERHATNASIFSSAGTYAPTLGVLGAVFGLIAAMGHIDDTEMMSEAIAAAFIATILGIFTGYVLWNPFATKLKVKTKEEVVIKNMIMTGILEIQKGTQPAVIKEVLISLLPEKEQSKVAGAKK